MNLIHRGIDFEKDRDYILERHCRINYACESPWKREMSYLDYRAEWFSFTSQVSGFYGYFERTAQDDRTIAEIIEGEDGCIIGYLWVTFCEDVEMDFRFAEIQEIYIEEEFRRHGVAIQLYEYAEAKARRNNAKVIRSGTGLCNSASIQLHERLGFSPYRYEFETFENNMFDTCIATQGFQNISIDAMATVNYALNCDNINDDMAKTQINDDRISELSSVEKAYSGSPVVE